MTASSSQRGNPSDDRDSRRPSFLATPPVVPPLHRTTQLAYLGLVLAAIGYSIYLLQPQNRGSLIPWLILVTADGFVLARALGTAWTVLAGDRLVDSPEIVAHRAELRAGESVPTIDALIPVYGEPLWLIERTVTAARDMHLPHRTIVCDDANDPAVAEMAARLGVEYRTRLDNVGAKAGNVNAALAATTGEYVALFDADMEPHPEFLTISLGYFVDPKLAFVQTPQTYRNKDDSFIARGAADSQRIFYELICSGMNAFNSTFHVGTNAVFRRSALDDVGGFYQQSNSEDIWTSYKMHEAGWSSHFAAHTLAQGLAPDRLEPFLKQQERWATGAFEILFQARPYFSKRLTLDQRLQYTLAPLHFAQSVPILWFTVLPALFLLIGIQPLSVDGSSWLLRYLPFWLLTNAVVYLQVGAFNFSSMAISIMSAPRHVRAAFNVLARRSTSWNVTNRGGREASVVDLAPVQISLALLNATGFVVGILVLSDPSVSLIALVLCVFHVTLISRVLRSERQQRRQAEALPRLDRGAAEPAPPVNDPLRIGDN